MERPTICLRIDRHRADAELSKRAEDPHGDLTAIRDEDAGERDRHNPYSPQDMPLADQLTVARAVSVIAVIALFEWEFTNHLYWATALFIAAMATDQVDGWLARRQGGSSVLGSVLDPVADKVLVMAMLIMVLGAGAFPSWMVALIVAREFLVSGLRLAAIERGVVISARDLGKLKTWAQAVAAAIGGFAAAGAWSTDVAWWALLVALVFTWVSGLDYARAAPRLLRGPATS
jgi:CDP-diacylglycerol--glycerol-3-phosphate 3-phosphatidyltransferase